MKKVLAFGVLIAVLFSYGLAQDKKNLVSLFGGVNSVIQYGSEDDYAPGENDFPVTPAHNPLCFGLSYLHLFSGRFGLELDGRYTLNSRVTLSDPSDGDTVDVDTLKHAGLTLNALLFLSGGSLRPYFALGGGGDFVVNAKEQTLTTRLGYLVTFAPPANKADLTADAGVGLLVGFGPSLGLRLDIRYIFLPKTGSHALIHNVNAMAGLAFSLF
jgi:outer membrane protein W